MKVARLASHGPFPQKQSVDNHSVSDLEPRNQHSPRLAALYARYAEEKTMKGQGGRAAREKKKQGSGQRGELIYTADMREGGSRNFGGGRT